MPDRTPPLTRQGVRDLDAVAPKETRNRRVIPRTACLHEPMHRVCRDRDDWLVGCVCGKCEITRRS